MAWKLIDDFTGEVIDPSDAGHRLTICIDSVEVRGYDVAAGNPDDLIAALGEHLSGTAAPLVDPEPLNGESERDVEQPQHEGEGNREDRGHDGDVDEVLWVADDAQQIGHVHTVATGEATRGRPSDATVRAWCASWGVQCSTTGKLNHSARDAYERVGGGEPDGDTVRDEPTERNRHPLPASPPTSSADDETHYPGDGCTPPHPHPLAPAVEPLGQHLTARQMTHAQKLDEAERLLAQRQTPAQVAAALELEVSEVRDLLPRPGGRRR